MSEGEIIRMAREAGIVRFEGGEMEAYGIRKADQFDHTKAFWSFASPENLARFAALVAAVEREAIIDIIEEYRISLPVLGELKADIRARGEK